MTHRHLRRVAAAAAAIGLVFALYGCGSGASAPEAGTASGSGLLPPAEGKVTYPIQLDTAWGTTQLTKRPERIAAVTPSQDDVEALAALGVTPFLASSTSTYIWLERALPTPVPERYERGADPIPIERIAAAKPDLIVVLGVDLTKLYPQLSAIAPVLATAEAGETEFNVANNWRDNLTLLGDTLDLKDAAQAALDTEDETFADLRAQYPQFKGKTASYVVFYPGNTGLQFHSTAGSPAGSVYEAMGLSLAPAAKDLTYRQVISNENLGIMDADIIVFSDNSGGAHAEITESRLFKQLGAAKKGGVILLTSTQEEFEINGKTYDGNLPWALARSGPLSGTWAAEQLAPVIAEALGSGG